MVFHLRLQLYSGAGQGPDALVWLSPASVFRDELSWASRAWGMDGDPMAVNQRP